MHIYTYTSRIHIDAIIITSEDFFKKICTSHFICKVACERELETEQRLQPIDLPSRSGHRRVSFSFSWTAPPGAWGLSLSETCSHSGIFSLTGLVSKLNRDPFFWVVAFSTTSCLQHILSPTHWLPVSTELYNSSIAHSISLEWHVCSSSSGNNCHAVHRSLSSSASVHECTVGF